jgi:gamma-glutamyltranspeptidase / glutathione hydrolase
MKNLLLVSLALCVMVVGGGCTRQIKGRPVEPIQRVFARGAVAADHEAASWAGRAMLVQGGNAVDAAVAASFTLAVVRPESCGLGGGGFMVIHLPDDPTHGFVSTAINYRETAYVDADYFERTGKSSTVGGAAVAVPGTVAGLLYALEHYGTLDRATVLAPAMAAARDGVRLDYAYGQSTKRRIEEFNAHPEMKTAYPLMWTHFLQAGEAWEMAIGGYSIANEPMYKTLSLIAEHGREGFTQGPVGEAIIDAVHKAGGEMTLADLDGYRPLEYEPLIREVDGYRFVTMGPPSSGGVTMLETLEILEALGYDFDNHELGDNAPTHQLIEALKHSFADRSKYLADPEFVDLPIDALLGEANIAKRAKMVTAGVHEPSYYGTADLLPEDHGTSHLSAVDPWGGAVACTETINLGFGSLVGVDEYGFLLNNEMDDFTTIRGEPNAFGLIQSDRNLPAPGKRPLSSMSPTIVLDGEGRVFAIAGASGGPRIITGTMEVLLNAMAGKGAGESVVLPRIHHQWLPDRLLVEAGLMDAMHQRAKQGPAWNAIKGTGAVGNVQIIVRDPMGRGWQAASDRRKGGRPAGID